MTTTQFVEFPFTHKGINFVSKVSAKSSRLPQILAIGDQFIQMNINAVDDLMNLDENSSPEYINSMLSFINEGGTEMFLELAGK